VSQKEFLGCGSISHVQEIIKEHHAQKILLVTGKKSFTQSGAEETLRPYLANRDVVRFSDFDINPRLEDAHLGIKLIRETKPDLIIGIGGGSVIDMGKLINILAAQASDNISQIIKNSTLIQSKGLPFIAIPTTAGTGSEATHFAVVYLNKIKYSLAHNYIIPDYAIVEPALTYCLSYNIAATSAMDALSQAVESYWAVASTDESKEYASHAIKMILPILKQAVNSDDKEVKNVMALAAHLAGKAINISKTTAAHAISYPITTYFNVPHGHAVALTLGKFFIINSDIECAELFDKRGQKYLKNTMAELYEMFGCSNAQACCDKWYDLMTKIGLETKLNVLGIKQTSDIELIINNINLERLNNNPIMVNEQILNQLFTGM
jgi:alcohol dehydrogenase class IV